MSKLFSRISFLCWCSDISVFSMFTLVSVSPACSILLNSVSVFINRFLNDSIREETSLSMSKIWARFFIFSHSSICLLWSFLSWELWMSFLSIYVSICYVRIFLIGSLKEKQERYYHDIRDTWKYMIIRKDGSLHKIEISDCSSQSRAVELEWAWSRPLPLDGVVWTGKVKWTRRNE